MILVRDIRLPLSAGEPQAFEKALHLARIPRSKAAHLGVARLSVDARHGQPKLVYTIAVTLKDEGEESAYAGASPCVAIRGKTDLSVQNGTRCLPHRPVVCGLGPAGLFAALLLARQGYKPIVLERGPALDERVKAVEHFSATGELDPNANIQFGEGGAGTFSDGKLTTRIGDPLCDNVLEILAAHGAPADIVKKAKPHVGTDILKDVVREMRREIIKNGGEVRFRTPLTGVSVKNGALCAVQADGQDIACERAVLAIGHSARDTFAALHGNGVYFEPKAFSVGVRIEHLQTEIDRALYGKAAGHPMLPPAEYNLSRRADGRACYSFCMCPGGYVVDASSEPGRLAVNGMSYHARDGVNANSALIVTVTPQDFPEDSPLAGIAYQRRLEEAAYRCGGGKIPVQLYRDFKKKRATTAFGDVAPAFEGRYAMANLRDFFPDTLSESLIEGVEAFNGRIAGFSRGDAILAGVESRTSSPVRIPRDERFESSIKGIYPCGEGAGYAGGITSAAMDGIKTAEAVAARFSVPT